MKLDTEYVNITRYNKSENTIPLQFTQSITGAPILFKQLDYKLNILKLKIPLSEADMVHIDESYPLVINDTSISGSFRNAQMLLKRINALITDCGKYSLNDDGSLRYTFISDNTFTMNKYGYTLLRFGYDNDILKVSNNLYRFNLRVDEPTAEYVDSLRPNESQIINWSSIVVESTNLNTTPFFISNGARDFERVNILNTITLEKTPSLYAIYNQYDSSRSLSLLSSEKLSQVNLSVYIIYENDKKVLLRMAPAQQFEALLQFMPKE